MEFLNSMVVPNFYHYIRRKHCNTGCLSNITKDIWPVLDCWRSCRGWPRWPWGPKLFVTPNGLVTLGAYISYWGFWNRLSPNQAWWKRVVLWWSSSTTWGDVGERVWPVGLPDMQKPCGKLHNLWERFRKNTTQKELRKRKRPGTYGRLWWQQGT